MPGLEKIRVEVAYAEPHRQFLRLVELCQGATVEDAIRTSNIEQEFAIKVADLRVGIWSKAIESTAIVSDGDRVEIYRPLKISPMEARRKRAKKRQD